MTELNDKQARFVEEYLVDLHATQAAIRAGYSEKTAAQQASRLLSDVKISDAIAHAKAERSSRTEITQDMVLKELAKVGFSDLRNVFTREGHIIDPQDWDDDTAGAVSSLEVIRKPSAERDEDGNQAFEYVHKFKVWDKVSALEKVGKHLGMFPNKHEVTGKDGGAIETKDLSGNDVARRLAFALAKGMQQGDSSDD